MLIVPWIRIIPTSVSCEKVVVDSLLGKFIWKMITTLIVIKNKQHATFGTKTYLYTDIAKLEITAVTIDLTLVVRESCCSLMWVYIIISDQTLGLEGVISWYIKSFCVKLKFPSNDENLNLKKLRHLEQFSLNFSRSSFVIRPVNLLHP